MTKQELKKLIKEIINELVDEEGDYTPYENSWIYEKENILELEPNIKNLYYAIQKEYNKGTMKFTLKTNSPATVFTIGNWFGYKVISDPSVSGKYVLISTGDRIQVNTQQIDNFLNSLN